MLVMRYLVGYLKENNIEDRGQLKTQTVTIALDRDKVDRLKISNPNNN